MCMKLFNNLLMMLNSIIYNFIYLILEYSIIVNSTMEETHKLIKCLNL